MEQERLNHSMDRRKRNNSSSHYRIKTGSGVSILIVASEYGNRACELTELLLCHVGFKTVPVVSVNKGNGYVRLYGWENYVAETCYDKDAKSISLSQDEYDDDALLNAAIEKHFPTLTKQ